MTFFELGPLFSGLAGLALYEVPHAGGLGSNWKNRIFGACMIGPTTYQALNMFPVINGASSFQLFCFMGCTLGSIGSMRLLVNMPTQLDESQRSLKTTDRTHPSV